MKNTIGDAEGVIKYQLEHRYLSLPIQMNIAELNAWRHILYRLELVGQQPNKYDGLGFGNISRRLVPGSGQFLISGTQTGHLPELTRANYALVEIASPEHNSIESTGLSAPSSEALTHALIYQHRPAVQAVIHVHSPVLWRHCQELGLAQTPAHIAYGTVAMTEAVKSLLNTAVNQPPVFAMLGHEDGMVAFGTTLAEAALGLLAQLARALAVE